MQVIYDYWNGMRVKDPEEDKKPVAGGMKRKA
jgi:hypothetical protein